MRRHTQRIIAALRKDAGFVAAGFLLISGILLLNSALSPVIEQKFLGQKDIRTIKVCVLNDNQNPVPENLLVLLLQIVFHEYEKNVGIRFIVNSKAYYHTETLLSGDGLTYFSTLCPEETDFRFAFTNSRVRRENGGLRFLTDNKMERTDDVAGRGDIGTVLIYGVGRLFLMRDAQGRPQVVNALLHEIGHLFKVPHNNSQDSFMYESLGSRGQWTPDVIDTILENKQIDWKKIRRTAS